jgi:hypothetical protein
MGTLQRYMGVIDGVKRGEPKNIAISFNRNVMTDYGYTYTDITDISMNLKLNLSTDGDDDYLEKKQSVNSQVIFDQSNNRFIMVINENDYNKLDWKTYYICINVKIDDSSLTKWIEIDRRGVLNRTVEIVKDTNRE